MSFWDGILVGSGIVVSIFIILLAANLFFMVIGLIIDWITYHL